MLSTETTIEPTDFQKAVLAFRGTCNIANLGGRGSGKSVSLLFDVLSHVSDYGASARPLIMRESHAGLLELFNEAYELCIAAFGSVQRNKSDLTLTTPTGAVIQFTNIGDEASYAKLQGRTFTALYADEAGNYSPTAWAFMMRSQSNLRVPPGRRAHVHITGNPGGKSHSKVLKTFVNQSPPWVPWKDENGQQWVWVSSNLQQNPHLDRKQYEAQLRASTDGNKALEEAWLSGAWTSFGGSMFDMYDPKVHMLGSAPPASKVRYKYVIGADWGTASPSVAILFGRLRDPVTYYTPEAPDGFQLPVGTIIALDETSTLASWDDLSVGTGAPPAAWADDIKDMTKRNGLRRCPWVIQDDAKGLASETVIGLLRDAGIPARRPHRKDRRGTWALMRQLLNNSVTGDGPGLYLTPRCRYLAETLPEAPRGPLNPEDLDHRWNEDHAIDAAGYGLRHFTTPGLKSGRTSGNF